MSKNSTIEWTGTTWNPTTGCDKISSGCKHCYAEVMSKRLKAMGKKKYSNGFDITLHPDSLNLPFSWKKPQVVFVNSMSDLFHEKVPLDYIQKVFAVMNQTPQHTYQILTKRAERLAELSGNLTWSDNIWQGVSVESNTFNSRIDELRKTGAKTKFLSLEPLIGTLPSLDLKGVDWVIVGGESGPGARPVNPMWVYDILQKCEKATVPFFFKQWGKASFNPDQNDPTLNSKNDDYAKGGCQLNGRIYHQMPNSHRIMNE
jgi:protein gp37